MSCGPSIWVRSQPQLSPNRRLSAISGVELVPYNRIANWED